VQDVGLAVLVELALMCAAGKRDGVFECGRQYAILSA
jgi:hypothetical protein